MGVSILFIIFNRISEAKEVFLKIRAHKPRQFFISADGPRPAVAGEAEKCQEVRDWVLNHIDWECDVQTLFRDTNRGCGQAVSEAITWFFDHVDEGIILEDDCLPSDSFFEFCEELLDKYRHDPQISIISGNNFQIEQPMLLPFDYYFSVFPSTWGWATWKRTWEGYHLYMDSWSSIDQQALLNFLFHERPFKLWWKKQFSDFHTHKLHHTWDFQFYYHCMVRQQLAVIPIANLVTNIGGGEDATHFKNSGSELLYRRASAMGFPLRHPEYKVRNYSADVYIQKLMFGELQQDTTLKKVKRFIKKVIRYNKP